jgi:hypothetical protein
MSPAPGVLIDLEPPCRGWLRAQQALGTVAMAGLLVWLGTHVLVGSGMVPTLIAVLLVAAAGFGLAWPLLAPPTPRGQLLWNTTAWLWLGNGAESRDRTRPGQARIAIDLGHWLLIEFSPATAPHRKIWLPASRRQVGPRWHALQCALRQRAGTDPNCDSPPPQASGQCP